MCKHLFSSVVCCFVWIALLSGQAFAAEDARELFNGKDLQDWDGNPELWSVEDGAIVGRTTAERPISGNTFLVYKGKVASDFRLTLEYRIEGGNSGVQYRSKVTDPKKWVVKGYQADIDSKPTYTGILYEEGGRGILTKRGQFTKIDAKGAAESAQFADPVELQKAVHTDDWNTYLIEVVGSHLKHTINEKRMSETDDLDAEKRSVDGVLALQVHAGPPMTVRFRKLRLEEVDAKSAAAAGAAASQSPAETGAAGK